MKTILLPVLFGSALLLAGCDNALVGEWTSKDAFPGCSGAEGTLTIDDNDLEGDGSVTVSDGVSCFDCDFDATATDNGDDQYDIELEFKDCTIGGSDSIDLECDLDDDTLDCDSDDVDLDSAGYDEWEREDD